MEEGEWRRRGWKRWGVKNNNLLSQNTHNLTHREWGRGVQQDLKHFLSITIAIKLSPLHPIPLPPPHPTFTQDQGHSLPSGPPPHHLLHIRGMRSSAVCLMSTVLIPQSRFGTQANPMSPIGPCRPSGMKHSCYMPGCLPPLWATSLSMGEGYMHSACKSNQMALSSRN